MSNVDVLSSLATIVKAAETIALSQVVFAILFILILIVFILHMKKMIKQLTEERVKYLEEDRMHALEREKWMLKQLERYRSLLENTRQTKAALVREVAELKSMVAKLQEFIWELRSTREKERILDENDPKGG